MLYHGFGHRVELSKDKEPRIRREESPASQSLPSFLPLGLQLGQEIITRFDLEGE
jgi:hypothetical protein